jgi:hypothetical protein
MATKEEIKAKIKEMPLFSRIFGWIDIPEIQNIIRPNEKLERIAEGLYHGENALLVSTNSRVIILNKRMFWGIKVKDFNYIDIRSVEYFTGIIFGSVSIVTEGEENELRRVPQGSAKEIALHIRNKVSDAKLEVLEPPSDDITKLERLTRLRDRGVISDDELSSEKKKILLD